MLPNELSHLRALDAGSTASSFAERYRVLLDIGRTLTGTLGLEELYQVIYRETSRVLEASGFCISLYDAVSDLATVVFYAERGSPRRVAISYRGSDSEVIGTGQPSLVEDRAAAKPVLVLGEDDGEITRSAISAPLRHGSTVLGAISAQSYRPRAYTPLDLELLEGIAGLAAVAIENARYVSELETRRQEAERIEEIGLAMVAALDPQEVLGKVIDACLAVIDADGAAVWRIETEDRLARVAASGGRVQLAHGAEWKLEGAAAALLMEQRAPLVIEDLATSPLAPGPLRDVLDSGSAMAAPLLAGGEVGGVLSVVSKQPRHFGQEDARILQRLASQTSVALENARLHADLRALSLTDPLTGLANRRRLELHLERETAAAQRGRPISAVIFDLDDFKVLNDTHGHPVGDEILRAFARILTAENRAMNLVARYGGDEFLSVLSDSPVEETHPYAIRVLKRVLTDPVLSRYGVRVSSGVAKFDPSRMGSSEDLISAADAALYRQKAARPGRDPLRH